MATVNYTFYTKQYFGNAISEEDFPRLSARASDYIKSCTGGLSDRAEGEAQKMVKKATCAVAEAMQDEENLNAAAFAAGGRLTGETVGNWSRSYASVSAVGGEAEALEKRKQDALRLYLGNVPLFAELFRVRSYPNVPAEGRRGGCPCFPTR